MAHDGAARTDAKCVLSCAVCRGVLCCPDGNDDSKSVGGNPMRVRLSPRASVLVGLLWAFNALLAVAQQPSLRGTVVSAEAAQPLGFSIVTLHPNIGRQFTDTAGGFAFADTKSGPYLLSVRQIGYAPLDTQVVIKGASATIVRIALRHLAIEL